MTSLLLKTQRASLALAGLALLAAAIAWSMGATPLDRITLVAGLVCWAFGLGSIPSLRTMTFTAWVVAAVVAAIFTPQFFQPFAPGTANYKLLLLLLVQAVMFGMGTQMSLRDFAGVVRTPAPVAIGLLCQFTIMPLLGYGLAVAFRLPPEVSAGMVLMGSCSSGLASNVMAYIGKANLALSITLTAVATLLAPLVTPFWMNVLASSLLEGTTIDLSFFKMMISIVKIVLVPTGAALIHDYLRTASGAGRAIVWIASAVGIVLPMGLAFDPFGDAMENSAVLDLAAWVFGAVAFGTAYHLLVTRWTRVPAAMPALAMAGIVYVTGMTTAEGRDALLAVGLLLVLAVALHNLFGYLLGYGLSRACGMDAQSARTVAFEVGMQNGGMATGLAVEMGKLGTLGLPAAIFIAWMNVSGSLLANVWRRNPVTIPSETDRAEPPTQTG